MTNFMLHKNEFCKIFYLSKKKWPVVFLASTFFSSYWLLKVFYISSHLKRDLHSWMLALLFFNLMIGERPYHCKHCDKSFATTISLKTHTYIHTGEKPHKCPHCPKTFATSSKLGRHIVTHSEQRPFACEHCPKSFNRSGKTFCS